MKITVIILHYGRLSTTKECLKNLSKKIDNHQVVLINNTKEDITDLGKIIKGTKIINNEENVGFAKGVNQGINLAQKDKSVTHYFLMNNDLSLSSGSFNQLLLTFTKFKNAGVVSPVLRHNHGYDWGGRYNKWTGMVKHKNWINKPKTIQTVEHVAGASMLISREAAEKIGLFDERFFLYFEDLDYCLRVRKAGFTIHINPEVIADHAVSSGSNAFKRTIYQWNSHLKFTTKHLFKLTLPTAYLFNLIFYPLVMIKLSLTASK